MDHFEPNLRILKCPICFGLPFPQKADTTAKTYRTLTLKNGIAPRAALLTALWGEKPDRKAPVLLVFGSGAYVHQLL